MQRWVMGGRAEIVSENFTQKFYDGLYQIIIINRYTFTERWHFLPDTIDLSQKAGHSWSVADYVLILAMITVVFRTDNQL